MTYVDEMVQKAVQDKSRVDGIFDLLWQDWPDLQSEANKAVLISYHERTKVPITLQSLKETIQWLLSDENHTGFALMRPRSPEEVAEYQASAKERAEADVTAEHDRLLAEIEKRLVAKGMAPGDIDDRMKQFRFRNNQELSSVLFSLDETVRLRNMSRDQLKQEMKASVAGRDPYATGTFPPLPSSHTNESLRALAKTDFPAFKRLQTEYGLDQLDERMGNLSKARVQPGVVAPASPVAPPKEAQPRQAQVFTLPKEIEGEPLTSDWIKRHPKRIRELARLAGRGNAALGFKAVTARLNNKG